MAATTTANQNIMNRLTAFGQIHPASAKLLTGWMLDPGDIVTVTQGEDSYQVPVYNLDVTWKGDSTASISSTGSEKRPPLSELKRRTYSGQRTQAETQDQLDGKVSKTTYNSYVEKTDNKIALVVTETAGGNVVNAGQIVLEINRSGSLALIEATQIKLDGNTTLGGALTIDSSGNLLSSKPIASTAYLKGTYLTLSDGTDAGSILAGDIGKFVKSMTLTSSGNNYTLAWTDGAGSHSVNFSRATSLTGSWDGGIYTVSASPQGTTDSTHLSSDIAPSTTRSGNIYTIAWDIGYDQLVSGEWRRYASTGRTGTLTVDASEVWQEGYVAGGGGQITTPTLNAVWGSGAQTGRFTVDTTPTAATNPLEYWFSKGTVTWSNNVATVPITTAPSQQGTATTRFSVSVDASSVWTAGVNSVTVGNITGTAIESDETKVTGIGLTATASNGATGSGSLTMLKDTYTTGSGSSAVTNPSIDLKLGTTVIGRANINCSLTAGGVRKKGQEWWDTDPTSPTYGQWVVESTVTKTFAAGITAAEDITINIQNAATDANRGGWTYAVSKVDWPDTDSDSNLSDSFGMTVPSSTYTEDDTKTFEVAQSGDYAYVTLDGVGRVARCSVSGTTNYRTATKVQISPRYDGGHVIGSTVVVTYTVGGTSSFTSNTPISTTTTWQKV